jgi:CheY-like chemotaxis protein
MTKILIVDQDQDFAAELRAELSRHHCSVRVAADGPAGLTAAAAEHPDLVVLSAEVQRINGFSVCNKLKKSPALGAVPVLLLSSRSTPEAFEHHQRLPTRADDYIHKPISLAALITRISALVPLGLAPGEGDDGPLRGSDLQGSSTPSDDLPAIFDDGDEEELTVVAGRHDAAAAIAAARAATRPSVRPSPPQRSSLPFPSAPPPPLRTGGPGDALSLANQHLADVSRQLAEAERRAKAGEQRAARAEQRAEQLAAEKALADKRAADFKLGAKKIADQLNQRSRELREAQSAHAAGIREIERTHAAAIRSLEERLRRESAEVAAGRQHDRAALEARIGELEQQHDDHEASEVDRLLAERGRLEARVAELEEALARLSEERVALEEQHLRRLDELREEQEKHAEDLQRENAEALQQMGYELQEKLMQKEESFKALKEQLDGDIAEMSEEAAGLRERLLEATAARAEAGELEQRIAELAEERDEALAHAQAVTADADEQRQELARERARLDAASEQIALDRALLRALREQLIEIVTRIPSVVEE